MRSTARQVRAAGILFASTALFATSAHADARADKIAAQALFDQGKELMSKGNLVEACPKLEESQRLDPTSGTLINLADCYEKAGRVATAWSAYVEAASAAKLAGHADRERIARERAATLAQKLPKIAIHVLTSGVEGLEIRRDGAVVGSAQWGMAIPTDAGQHRIVATAPGREPWETVVTLRESDTVPVIVPLLGPTRPAPSTPATVDAAPSSFGTQRVLALVAGGVGVAGLTFGTVFGLVSKSKHDQANEHCEGTVCRDGQGVDLRNDALRAGNVSTVGFVVGALGLAGGAALWLTAPDEAKSGPSVGVGIGSIVVSQRW